MKKEEPIGSEEDETADRVEGAEEEGSFGLVEDEVVPRVGESLMKKKGLSALEKKKRILAVKQPTKEELIVCKVK